MRNQMVFWMSGLALLSVLVVPALAQQETSTAGYIAFIAYSEDNNGDGQVTPVGDNGHLWVVDSACAAQPESCGEVTAVLTAAASDERDPAWSPDGTRIAYASRVDLDGNGIIDNRDFRNLYAFTLADGTITRITNSFTIDGGPDWAAAGDRLTFQSVADTNGDAFVTFSDLPAVNVINAGGGGRALIASGVYSVTPVWNPANDTLVYVSFAEDAPEGAFVTSLFRISPEGGARTQLTGPGSADRLPSWSPDGARIAFIATTDTNGDGVIDVLSDTNSVAVISADGAGLVTLAACDPFVESLAWSPDGARIAYTYQGSLYTVDSRTPGATLQLTGEGFNAEAPAWSPDGATLAFTSNGRLYVLPAAGGTPVALTQAGVYVAQPTWSPASPSETGPAIEAPANVPTATPEGTG